MYFKAVTVWQPWASLIAHKEKRIETRSWSTKYRGPLAIHAGASINSVATSSFWKNRAMLINSGYKTIGEMPRGSVVAICELVDCVLITPEFIRTLSTQEKALGDYTIGRYAWILRDVKKLTKPVRARGRQRLWDWEQEAING